MRSGEVKHEDSCHSWRDADGPSRRQARSNLCALVEYACVGATTAGDQHPAAKYPRCHHAEPATGATLLSATAKSTVPEPAEPAIPGSTGWWLQPGHRSRTTVC